HFGWPPGEPLQLFEPVLHNDDAARSVGSGSISDVGQDHGCNEGGPADAKPGSTSASVSETSSPHPIAGRDMPTAQRCCYGLGPANICPFWVGKVGRPSSWCRVQGASCRA